MKAFILLIIQCLFLVHISAQNRYANEIFSEVQVTSDVVYGNNATNFFTFPLGSFSPIDLEMDIYEPVGDDYEERPLVLVFHDGNFLPPLLNGSITGSRKDSSIVEICTQLARRGFTSAAVSYRLGWNPLAASQVFSAVGLLRALHRGVQDGRTAIRFFRKNHAEDNNEYNIDPNRITAWGVGSGALVCINMVALSDIDDYVIPKFIIDADNDGVPETPMIQENIDGDIEGKSLTVADADFFGISEGDTTSYENHVDYSSEFHLSVNVGGAVGYLGWLEDNSIPMVSFHALFDPIYPYDQSDFISGVNTLLFDLQGSKLIAQLQESLGNNQAWKDAIDSSDPYTLQAIQHSTIAEHLYYEGLYPFVNGLNSNGFHEGIVIDWWDPNAPSPENSVGMGLPWNEVPSPGDPSVSIHEYELLTNENMSAEKARANIDTIMNYFIPRACVTLELMECFDPLFSNEVQLESNVNVFPNPTNGSISLDVGQDNAILGVQIYTFQDVFIEEKRNLNASKIDLRLDHLLSGMYLLKIQTVEGSAIKKIIVE